MFKYKKNTLKCLTILFVLLSIIEFIKYFYIKCNLYGFIYLIINLIIIFLLVPVTYNYNRYYSIQRISKLIIILIFGIFNNYILYWVVSNNLIYIDSSIDYYNSIFIYKNILKGILLFLLFLFTIFEFKLDKLLKKIENNNKKNNKKLRK